MPTMRALYSLLSRLRTFHALAQATVTLAVHGWTAATPAQLLVLACGFGVALRVLIPSPAPGCGRSWVRMDHLLRITAAASIIGLAASGIASSWFFVAGIVLGV
jgi:hypothetical protein